MCQLLEIIEKWFLRFLNYYMALLGYMGKLLILIYGLIGLHGQVPHLDMGVPGGACAPLPKSCAPPSAPPYEATTNLT